MKTTTIRRISIFILISLLVHFSVENALEMERIRVVDYQFATYEETDKFNIIFRSNVPEDETHTQFEYDQLIDYMINIAKSEKRLRIDKEDIFIFDYSLLQLNDSMRITEEIFFQTNPSKGILLGWPVLGEEENPEDYSKYEVYLKSQDLSWMGDHIEVWIDELYRTLNSFHTPHHLLILVHCHLGKDRTGEISGAYQLKYSRLSWQEVMATNWEIYSNHIEYNNQRALSWFCYHLQYHQNYTHLNCTNENLSQISQHKPKMVGWDLDPFPPPQNLSISSSSSDQSCDWKIAFIVLVVGEIFVFIFVLVIGFGFWKRNFLRGKLGEISEKFRVKINRDNVGGITRGDNNNNNNNSNDDDDQLAIISSSSSV